MHLCEWSVLLQCPDMLAMGSHTAVSAVLFTLTASVWMAAGVTQTCPMLAGIPGRDGRDGPPGPPGPPGALCTLHPGQVGSWYCSLLRFGYIIG